MRPSKHLNLNGTASLGRNTEPRSFERQKVVRDICKTLDAAGVPFSAPRVKDAVAGLGRMHPGDEAAAWARFRDQVGERIACIVRDELTRVLTFPDPTGETAVANVHRCA